MIVKILGGLATAVIVSAVAAHDVPAKRGPHRKRANVI